MAARQPLHCKQTTTERPVTPHRLRRVGGAGGVEAAGGREQRRDEPPVEPDEPEQERADHRRAPLGTARSARRAASRPPAGALDRAITTRSMAGSRAASARNASRTHRFTRLRVTASPTRDETVTPSRGPPRSFSRVRRRYAPAGVFLPR